jgi:hypothetical protein
VLIYSETDLTKTRVQNGNTVLCPCNGNSKILVLSTFLSDDGHSCWTSEETVEIRLAKSETINLWIGNVLGE